MNLDLAKLAAPCACEVDLRGGLQATFRPWTGVLEAALDGAVDVEARAFIKAPDPEPWGFAAEAGDLGEPALFARLWALIEVSTRAAYRITAINLVLEDSSPFPLVPTAFARLFHRGLTGDGGAVHLEAFLAAEAAHA